MQGLLGKTGNLENVIEGVISKVAEEKAVLDEEIDQDQAEMTDKQVMDKYDRNYVDLNICLFSEGQFSRLDTSTSKIAQAMLYAMYQAEACKQGRGNDFLFKKKIALILTTTNNSSMFIVVYLYCQYFTESLKSYETPIFYDTRIYPTLAQKLLEVLPFETGPQSRKLKERLDGLLPGELKRVFCLLK